MKAKKLKFKNGYSDRSGKGIITKDDEMFLATHWGCSCCDRETTPKDNRIANKICRILNKYWNKEK